MTQKPGAYQPGKDHMQGLGVTEGLVTCRNHASSGQDSRLGYYYNTLHLDFLCIYSGFLVYGSKLLRHGRGWRGRLALLSLCASLSLSKSLFLILFTISESLEWEFKDWEILKHINTVATIYEFSRIKRVSHS